MSTMQGTAPKRKVTVRVENVMKKMTMMLMCMLRGRQMLFTLLKLIECM
jgi:hypothetical protein